METQNPWGQQVTGTARLPRKPPKAILVIVAIIYGMAFGVSVTLAVMIDNCESCEQVPGNGKQLFTTILAGASAAFAFGGLGAYLRNHHTRRYLCMSVMPPIYAILCLLWITNFAIYAVSFLNSDLDLMKRVIWLSLASSGLYFIITLVSSFDWRKYGSGSSNDVGIYRLENVNINTNDTGGQHISSSTQDS